MRQIEEQILRAQLATGCVHEKDLAALLGLSQHAFCVRKIRGRFPKKELLILAISRPDIDADYILNGDRKEPPFFPGVSEKTIRALHQATGAFLLELQEKLS
ncbi:MAG: helix-turn-helix domain containing protein [Zoogloeaceae bacterium]|jgi:hypothetical protein|nr:helix-turn-helix domain containing protein [Zoogloeaceae bacterium]